MAIDTSKLVKIAFFEQFCEVHLADHGRQHMRVLGVIVVAGAVHIGRHGGDEVGAVLAVVGIAQPDAGDLGDRVRLVGRLERSGQQVLLFERLRGQLGVNAARPEEEQFFHAVFVRRVNHVHLDHHVFVDELPAIEAVGLNAADLGGNQHDDFGLFFGEERLDRRLIDQIDLLNRAPDQIGIAVTFEGAPDAASDESQVSGDVDF
jgi:hypothetical protein